MEFNDLFDIEEDLESKLSPNKEFTSHDPDELTDIELDSIIAGISKENLYDVPKETSAELTSEEIADIIASIDAYNQPIKPKEDIIRPIQSNEFNVPINEKQPFMPNGAEFAHSSADNALALMRAREIKKTINELERRIAEEKQNLIDDEEWVMTPGLTPMCRSEIYKDISNYKLNIVFLEGQLQKSLEQLKEIESLLGDNNERSR